MIYFHIFLISQNIIKKNMFFLQKMLFKFLNQQQIDKFIKPNQRKTMDFLREIVGGPKNRYKQNGFNLDLTYITNRIVAMAFPASGIQKLYRNSIDSVAQFLAKNHNDKYITVNLSGREIDQAKLKNVKSYDWQDHRSPTFDLLFKICYQVSNFLKQDSERVAVFHCNHGKGRTGTIICCFILYTGVFKQPKQALRFYAQKRFQTADGYGVTQPAQIKYIEYFWQSLIKIRYPKVVAIKAIVFKSKDIDFSPYFKVKYVADKSQILKSKDKNLNVFELKKDDEVTIRINESIYFAGDVVLELKKQNSLSHTLLGSYMFNTAFIDTSRTEKVLLKNITPLSAQKSGNLPQNLQMTVQFKDTKPIGQRCSKCRQKLSHEAERWKFIELAVQNQKKILEHGFEITFGKGKQKRARSQQIHFVMTD